MTTLHIRSPWPLRSLALAGLVLAGDAAAQDTVYHWRKTVWPDGRTQVDTPVTELADWLDSGAGWVDMDRLVDSRGRSYRLEADAFQDDESEPVQYEMRLRLDPERAATPAELERAWLEANPRATPAELAAFRLRRAQPTAQPPSGPIVADALVRWASMAAPAERLDLVVLLREEVPFHLPRVAAHLFQSEPAFALSQREARILAIEERKTALELSQAPIVEVLRAAGGELTHRYWLLDGFECRVGPQALRELLREPRVELLEVLEQVVDDAQGSAASATSGGSVAASAPPIDIGSIAGPFTPLGGLIVFGNTLRDMRIAVQMPHLHDAGYKGEQPSGVSNVNDMFLAIIDTTIDANHPAWNDTSAGSSRLTNIWRFVAGVWLPVFGSATSTPSHGTAVSGNAVGDLTQGQDASVTGSLAQSERTGLAPEASFTFIEYGGAGISESIEHAASLSPDVINLSASTGSTWCSLTHSTNEFVDAAMLDGAFFAKSASNNGNGGSSCTIGNPGTASGAFTVGAIDRTAKPLQGGAISSGSSQGGDSIGRAVVAMAAPTGPELARTAAFDDSYSAFGATSGAAPVVAGSAAVLKEHLLDVFSSALVNEVGFQYATMLMMGDGQLTAGGTAMAFDPADDVYGMGRLRLRMFNAAGMDAPWRARLFSRTISDGEVVSDLLANPDGSGVNQDIPVDVDRLKAAAFWHEPNLELGASFAADIGLSIFSDTGLSYGSGNSADHHQRLWLGNVVQGKEWSIRLSGNDVPPSFDTNYHYLQDERKVYVGLYWEDLDRDDADGPDSDIQ